MQTESTKLRPDGKTATLEVACNVLVTLGISKKQLNDLMRSLGNCIYKPLNIPDAGKPEYCVRLCCEDSEESVSNDIQLVLPG